uniref:Uncharacterized protein n=2 Tax=Meloidogyne enterolobii TaxID=390850 RepID=A0A6V7WQY2_MELEN|nr:unnamed protein product [Meloidogyne enterolobii]
MKQLLNMELYFINKFADQLENICLKLNTHSLPQVCKPRASFLLSNGMSNTLGDKLVYQARSEVTARVDIAGQFVVNVHAWKCFKEFFIEKILLGNSNLCCILAGALLSSLHKLSGNKEQQLKEDKLINQVLQIEQLHTSGGGWQDQLGGCISGGAKIGWVESVGERKCCWRSVPLGGELIKEFSKRFVLLYTGKTRLAKTLLKQVLLSWARQEPQILATVERLAKGAWKAEEMLIEGKFPSEVCTEYNELKKIFASNTEPSQVTELKNLMEKENLIESAWMAGAGGGGFLYIWLKQTENNVLDKLENLLKSDGRWKEMNIWRVELEDKQPLIVN